MLLVQNTQKIKLNISKKTTFKMILMLILTLVNLMQCASGCDTCSDCSCHYYNGEYSAYCLDQQEVHQCGNSCISHSEPCNGTCLRDGDWICDGHTEPKCYPSLGICNGRKDGYYGTCSNVFKDCPDCFQRLTVLSILHWWKPLTIL